MPMIKSYRDRQTAKLAAGIVPKGIGRELAGAAHRKLVMLDAAARLEDLAARPGLRLEKLSGDRAGQHSIRVNIQWRICFVWSGSDAEQVEFCDYH